MLTASFLPFLLMSVLIELTPGPNMAWLALTAASVGRRAALSATAGIASGLAVVGLVSAFGLAELATAFPALFAMLRYAGAAYLLFLAWQAWRGEREISGADLRKGDVRTWYRHGLALNLLNPKAFLFFIAILPNYVDATQPVMPQTSVAVRNLCCSGYIGPCAAGGTGRQSAWLVPARGQCGMDAKNLRALDRRCRDLVFDQHGGLIENCSRSVQYEQRS